MTHDEIAEGKPSASSFDSDFRCLGKRALEKEMPPEKESKAASRGTSIHHALAISDLGELSPSDSITASRCMYAESQIVHEYGFEGFNAWWEGHPEPMSELPRLWETSNDLETLWSVQLDSLLQAPDKTRILAADYKTGFMRTQPIASNWQVIAECVAAAFNPQSPGYGAKQVLGALIHPHHPDSLYEVRAFNSLELEGHRATINGLVALIEQPDQPRTPNDVSCAFCRAKGVCPEYKAQAKQLMKDIRDEHENRGFAALLELTPEERGQRMAQLKRLEKIIVEQKDRFVELVKGDAEAVTGYRLTKKWDMKVKDEGKILVAARVEFGELAASHAVKFSVPALIDFLKKDMGTKEAKVIATEKLKPFITFKPSREYLMESKP